MWCRQADPSGSEAFTAFGAPYSIRRYATADRTVPVKSCPTVPDPNAVALSADGTLLGGLAWGPTIAGCMR
jgi:hypothetical protein